jgi:hypothetical protein
MVNGKRSTPHVQFGDEPGILHVMFHGTFVFDFHGDYVDVLIPQVEGHVYRAGSWLGETELTCGHSHTAKPAHDDAHNHDTGPERYELEGVEPGSGTTLPLEHNLMRSSRLRPDVDSLLHARIRAPLPDRIATPRRGRLPASGFSPQGALPKDYNGQLGTIQIFTYRFPNDNALRLACHAGHSLWEPAFAGGAVTLHIIAAPEHFHLSPPLNAARTSHVQNAFAACMALYQGVRLTMLRLPDTNEFDPADLRDGAIPEETEDLAPRIRRLSQLGRMRKDDRDLNLLWFSSEAYDGDPDACNSSGNRGN